MCKHCEGDLEVIACDSGPDGNWVLKLVQGGTGKYYLRTMNNRTDIFVDFRVPYCPACGRSLFDAEHDTEMQLVRNTVANWPQWKRDIYNQQYATAERAMKF